MSSVLLFSQKDVGALLSMKECIRAVEEAFRLYGEGLTSKPGVLGVHAEGGGFHMKAGILDLGRKYFAAKLNGNFPDNQKKHSLPTIQGILLLCDAVNGQPLALMDSIEITIQRTGAATAVAAKHLARKDSSTALICGCGLQGRSQLRALMSVLPLKKVVAYDADPERARKFADEVANEYGVQAEITEEVGKALPVCDICVTCTPAKKWLVGKESVPEGMFIAAVGADNEEKQELEPALMASSRVVTDITDQCAAIGDLHHAIEAGTMARTDVHAELGEIVAGKKPGRTSASEVTIFDSTGMALQDVAAAVSVYEAALRSKTGQRFELN